MSVEKEKNTFTAPLDIEKLRIEIDEIDRKILDLIKRRTDISKQIGSTRLAAGGTKLVHSREMQVINRFTELGDEGHNLAMILLRLGRGQLGKK